MSKLSIALVARNQTIDDLVRACAKGELVFSGENSLCEKVSAMGYKITALHEMVCAAEEELGL